MKSFKIISGVLLAGILMLVYLNIPLYVSAQTIATENPIGSLDSPGFGATLNGTQTLNGWLLDESGVEKIEVLVDGEVDGLAIYGDPRPDVKQVFPQYNNDTAGFHYALDTTNFDDGIHTVTIRAIGNNDRVTTLPDSTIMIKNENSRWYFDHPTPGAIVRGLVNVQGWFLNESGVEKIEILVDGKVDGLAIYGDLRPEVKQAFPQYNNETAGFHYELDTTKFPDGRHTVTIKITGDNGHVTILPARTVTFNQSMSIFLDPGHGGSDPGATAGEYYEANLNLAVAKKVQLLLLDRGYSIYMSRNDDTYLSLQDRSQTANDLGADLFISIHTNSTGSAETTANGIESFYYEDNPDYPSKINANLHNDIDRIKKSVTLTNIIQDKLVQYTGATDRGAEGQTFSVVRESAMPATLIEMGFINNSNERQKLMTDSYQNKLAKAIADGIDEYFKIY